MNRPRRFLSILIATALLHACGNDETESSSAPIEQPAGGTRATPDADPFADCTRGTLEADNDPSPFSGPGTQAGELAPGQYVMSSTYLQLKPDKLGRFQELIEPIQTDLRSRDGVIALSFGGSPTCGTARTLSVWRDDAAMFAFVTGEAHSAAVLAIGELSRGGSVVTHWTGDQTSATWEDAARHLAADDGPKY